MCTIVLICFFGKKRQPAWPSFITEEGKGWTNSVFCVTLQSIMEALKLKKHHYNTHSFRIGAAASALLANISDTNIQMLGLWQSNAFQCYIRLPPTELAKLSKLLAKGEL